MNRWPTDAIVTEQAEARFGELAGGVIYVLENLKKLIRCAEDISGEKLTSAHVMFSIDAIIESFRTGRELDIDFLNKMWEAHDL
jgi:hypothetical protein